MDTHHSEMGHEQKQTEPSISPQETIPAPPSPPPTHPGSRRWLVAFVSVLIVLLLAASAGYLYYRHHWLLRPAIPMSCMPVPVRRKPLRQG